MFFGSLDSDEHSARGRRRGDNRNSAVRLRRGEKIFSAYFWHAAKRTFNVKEIPLHMHGL